MVTAALVVVHLAVAMTPAPATKGGKPRLLVVGETTAGTGRLRGGARVSLRRRAAGGVDGQVVIERRLVDRRRLGALAGIVGPPTFVAVFVVEGWLRPGYDSRSMYLSELALGPRGVIFNVVAVVYGVLLLLFARGVAAEFPHGSASRWGPLLLRITGFTLIGLGLFVMDPLPTPLAQLSAHAWLHPLFGIVQSYAVPISCFVFLKRFREERQWRALAPWTLTTGMLTAALVVILKTIVYSIRLAPGNPLGAWGGLIQRLALVVWIGWQFAVALRLLALTRERAPCTAD